MRDLRASLTFILLALIGVVCIPAQVVNEPAKTATPAENLVAGLAGNDDRYRIGFQDVLDIQVFQHANLNQRVPVSPNGTITLFRLDRPIVAVCKTERELATELVAAYKAKFIRDPQVNVVVAEQKSQTVSVIGAVEKPGSQHINRRVHLLELLAMAGGPNKESGTRLIVARTGSSSNCKLTAEDEPGEVSVVSFKVRDVQEGKKTFWMQPGDVVSVLDADIVYVYGNVNQQGALKVRERITLTQAIASAEGLKSAARKDKIRVFRQSADGLEREELVFDLNKINSGKTPDPFLEPNDIVAVSEDKAKAILLGFANAVKNSAGSAVYRLP
jgi:polysaccharide export outer membrane protein